MPAKPPSLSRFRSAYRRQIALWILRAFASGEARRRFFDRDSDSGYRDDDLADFLGLPKGSEEAKAKPSVIGPKLDALLAALERDARPRGLPSKADRNLGTFGDTLDLTAEERLVLGFFACLRTEPLLLDTWNCLGTLVEKQVGRVLSRVLKLPDRRVDKILERHATLRRSRIIVLRSAIDKKRLTFASDGLAHHLFFERYDAKTVFEAFRIQAPPPALLDLSRYPHLLESLDLLLAYLRKAVKDGRCGVNVLVHGVPGTGKTQLARAVGESLGMPVYEIATIGENGEASSPKDRLKSLDFADRALSSRPSLLVFDEAEDVFGSTIFERSVASAHKGWFNTMLERNRWPVFWISNRIRGLDPAFVRRFDMVLEVPVPPRAERRRLAEATVGGLVGERFVERIAASETVAPAVLSRLGGVLKLAAGDLPRERLEAHLARLLGDTLKAQGHRVSFEADSVLDAGAAFDPAFLNTPQDLAAIAARLRPETGARLCLHGPPGTGKSAFGRWLAGELDRPLVAKRASDLLGRYVGETEERLGEAFEEATRDGAVLLLDEVDSFLGKREHARHSWEITCVNEMLTQIEAFPGILVCSTNRLEALDPASLRRFDLKVAFDYLRGGQVEAFFASQCRHLGLPEPGAGLRAEARRLDCCTPGDFASLARRHRFEPFAGPAELLAAVREEIRHRHPARASIGFAERARLS